LDAASRFSRCFLIDCGAAGAAAAQISCRPGARNSLFDLANLGFDGHGIAIAT
jgi:hypothetical protein